MHVIEFGTYDSWVSAVFEGLREAESLIWQKNKTEDWFDGQFVAEHLEELYGVTCALAQTYMNRTWADITKYNLKINPGEKKREMIPMYGPKISQSIIAQVELVYNLANYWKHHDDWRDWAPMENDLRFQTIKILAAVGITQDTDFPCARGFELIRSSANCVFDKLESILFEWRKNAVQHHLREVTPSS